MIQCVQALKRPVATTFTYLFRPVHRFIKSRRIAKAPSDSRQIDIVQRSGDLHSKWYLNKYPDALSSGMSAAEHYFKCGATEGYNPGANFDTMYYMSTYSKEMPRGLNPLVHYQLYGKKKGYLRRRKLLRDGAQEVLYIRSKLLNFGFTEQPLLDLNRIVETSKCRKVRKKAAIEIALWKMRLNTSEGYLGALQCLERIQQDGPDGKLRTRIGVLQLGCYYHLNQYDEAKDVFDALWRSKDLAADHFLMWSNFHEQNSRKLELINQALDFYDIPNVALLAHGDGTVSDYDRLTCYQPLPVVSADQGPRVSILLAAYNSSATIPTALRSLFNQTWQNLEIIVIDDCSTDSTCEVVRQFQLKDERVKLVKMRSNGGAYVARNRGLEYATGDFITIHDADDWSHPLKIEVQVRRLLANKKLKGCTTEQARMTECLSFTRFPHNGQQIRVNVSSFMFRRKILKDMGCWLSARFGADSEFIFRIQKKYGKSSVEKMKSGPYSFQRVSDSSIVKNDFFGINGFYFGVRHELFSVSSQHIARGLSLKYKPDYKCLPYPIPNPMRVDRADPSTFLKYDVVIASDFRMQGGSQMSCLEELRALKKSKLRCAIFCMYRYDLRYPDNRKMSEATRVLTSELGVDVLNYGEKIECDLLLLRYPPILQHLQRYIPEVNAKSVKVIVNQPPMSDYSGNGVKRYDLKTCSENIRQMFNQEATWHPIGPLVRDALYRHHSKDLKHISLSSFDWVNIIDVQSWERPTWKKSRVMRIGRHSRDNALKWPKSKNEILSVYPASNDVQVHVLGGVNSILPVLGGKPKNWRVHKFDSINPREFLADLDVFVYFTNPDWVESFGRTIIEAMAVGVPVVLPEIYKPLFKDAALYATTDTALEVARRIYSDKPAYKHQVRRARAFVARAFGYEMNVGRLRNAGVRALGKMPTADLPRAGGKAGAKQMTAFATHQYDPSRFRALNEGLYHFDKDGIRYDFLWRPKAGASRLFVIFAGDAKRHRYELPVFQRWKWAEFFPGHCLYISDPSLYMHPKLSLAWYTGGNQLDPMVEIAELVQQVSKQVGVKPEGVWTYGSSGGGFAALRMANFLPRAGVIAVNPQTKITNYKDANNLKVDQYLQRACDGISREELNCKYTERVDLLEQAEQFVGRRVLYIQNVLDLHHYREHFIPFYDALHRAGGIRENSPFTHLLFYREGGHGKAESPDVFQATIDLVQSFSPDQGQDS